MGGGIVRIARRHLRDIVSFTMSTTTAGTPDGSRSARRLLVRLSVG